MIIDAIELSFNLIYFNDYFGQRIQASKVEIEFINANIKMEHKRKNKITNYNEQ